MSHVRNLIESLTSELDAGIVMPLSKVINDLQAALDKDADELNKRQLDYALDCGCWECAADYMAECDTKDVGEKIVPIVQEVG